MPTILTKRSNTPGAIPATANLTNAAGGAELAVNTADKRLFTITSGSQVVELGTNPASLTCADVSATVLRAGSATITNLIATTATVSDFSATVARISSLTISSLSLSNATFGSATITNLTSTSATISSALTLSAGTANGVLYLNGSKVATSGSALTFNGTNLGVGTASVTFGPIEANASVDTVANIAIVNSSSGTAAQSRLRVGNGGANFGTITHTGASFTTSGVFRQDGTYIFGNGTGGLTLTTGAAQPIYFAVDNTEGMRLTSTSLYTASGINVGIGTSSPTFSAGGGLHISNATAANVRLQDTTTNAYTNIWQADNGSTSSFLIDIDPNNVGSGGCPLVINTAGSMKVTLSSSGNLGLGVTPSAWASGYKAIDVNSKGFSFAGGVESGAISVSSYWDFGWKYAGTTTYKVSQYQQFDGAHSWYTAPSGTAGNTISFTQAMTLDASGNLMVGTTTANTYSGYSTFQLGQSTSGSIINFQGGATSTSSAAHIRLDCSGTTVSSLTIETRNQAGTASTPILFKTQETERARITSGGNLLVGTTNDYSRLTVSNGNSARSGITISDGNTASLMLFAGNSADAVIGIDTGNLLFKTGATAGQDNGSERARITSGGYFKASNTGTYAASTDPYHEFVNSTTGNELMYTRHSGASPYGITINYSTASPNGTGNEFLFCSDSTALRTEIRSNGGLANYQSNNVDLSDARTKKDIAPALSMWDKIGALEIVTYKYNDQAHDDVNVGVIAQQVEAVEPVWVDSDGFGDTPEDGVPLKTVYTKDITFAAIKALQEAMPRIEQLETKVAALESK